MMYDREPEDSDWTLFDDVLLGAFVVLGCLVGLSMALVVVG